MEETDVTETAVQVYDENTAAYDRFVSLFRYRSGIESFLASWDPLSDADRILDAGCGSGLITLALVRAMERRGDSYETIHGFDITPAMLDRFEARMQRHGIENVTARQADVRDLESLPSDWRDYDTIVSASMLEYVERDDLPAALSNLRDRLASDGTVLLFVTRKNLLMRYLIGELWQANRYSRGELRAAFSEAGFSDLSFHRFSCSHAWLNLWGHVVEARN